MNKEAGFKKYISDYELYHETTNEVDSLKKRIRKKRKLSIDLEEQTEKAKTFTAKDYLDELEKNKVIEQASQQKFERLNQLKQEIAQLEGQNKKENINLNKELKEKLADYEKEKEINQEWINNLQQNDHLADDITLENIKLYMSDRSSEDDDHFTQSIAEDIENTQATIDVVVKSTADEIKNIREEFLQDTQLNSVRDNINNLRINNLLSVDLDYQDDYIDPESIVLGQYKQAINETPEIDNIYATNIDRINNISKFIVPSLMMLLTFLLFLIFSDITVSFSALLVNVSVLALNIILPLFVAYFVNKIVRDYLNWHFFIRIILMMISFAATMQLVDSINISDNILEWPIIIVGLILVWILSKNLMNNYEINRSVNSFLMKKTPLLSKERQRISDLQNEYFHNLYIAHNYERLIHESVQWDLDYYLKQQDDYLDELHTESLNAAQLADESQALKAEELYNEYLKKKTYIQQYPQLLRETESEYQLAQGKISEKYHQDQALKFQEVEDIQDILSRLIPIYMDEVGSKIDDHTGKIKILKEKAEELNKQLKELYKELTQSLVSIDESQGAFSDYLFISKENAGKNDLTPVEINELMFNKEPIVFLYDLEDATKVSESLYPFVKKLTESFYLINSVELLDIMIIDPKDGAKEYEKLNQFIKIENQIKNVSEKVDKATTAISKTGHSINELNKLKYDEDGASANYAKNIISYFMIQDSQTSVRNIDYFNQEMWGLINLGGQYGFLPIFFISLNDWEKSYSEGGRDILFIENLKKSLGKKLKHIYCINKEGIFTKYTKGGKENGN